VLNEASKLGAVIVGVLTDKATASYKRLLYMRDKQRVEVVSNLKQLGEVDP
jgi:phosphoenolpyruvate phosphomutase / 2-hydroxyethylphosphonate cytidylyltransferase